VYTEKAIEMCRPVPAVAVPVVQLAPIVEAQPKAAPTSKAKKSNGNRPPEPAEALP
jgi:hypothetical protein